MNRVVRAIAGPPGGNGRTHSGVSRRAERDSLIRREAELAQKHHEPGIRPKVRQERIDLATEETAVPLPIRGAARSHAAARLAAHRRRVAAVAATARAAEEHE